MRLVKEKVAPKQRGNYAKAEVKLHLVGEKLRPVGEKMRFF